jgi:hypothetical protein
MTTSQNQEGLLKIQKKNIYKTETFYSCFSPDLKIEPRFEKKIIPKQFEASAQGIYKVVIKAIFG